jgi:hypothetical protein
MASGRARRIANAWASSSTVMDALGTTCHLPKHWVHNIEETVAVIGFILAVPTILAGVIYVWRNKGMSPDEQDGVIVAAVVLAEFLVEQSRLRVRAANPNEHGIIDRRHRRHDGSIGLNVRRRRILGLVECALRKDAPRDRTAADAAVVVGADDDHGRFEWAIMRQTRNCHAAKSAL